MFSKMSASIAVLGAALGFCLSPVSAHAAADYPTTAVADYVYACMKSNGETREALERCSCSIDVVASIVPYDDYVAAETFRRMALTTGEAAGLFRESPPAKAAGAELKRAQAEAEIRCF
ncbi:MULTISPECIES: hypothetical protein [Mesorhizobium]|uniref:Rap1a immunity protein domain-containing protein n=1 Tax=Mesorhizobium denitrificans TaxID=2294114 RepID=A0A371XC17_9HYPH|nr:MULTISPECIES: hypothetical protein [Mesorhizobium]RFC66778.1 hypothetical protein DY251_14690 [Mesorhizobium denitrificans]